MNQFYPSLATPSKPPLPEGSELPRVMPTRALTINQRSQGSPSFGGGDADYLKSMRLNDAKWQEEMRQWAREDRENMLKERQNALNQRTNDAVGSQIPNWTRNRDEWAASQWEKEQRDWAREDRKYGLSQRKDKFGLEQQLADAEYLKALAVFLQAGGNVGMLKDNPTAAKFLSGIFKNMQANPYGGSSMVQPWTGSTGIDNKPAGWFTGEYAAQQRGKQAALNRAGAAIDRFMGSKLSNGARVFSTTTSADGSLTGYKAQWDPLPMTNRRITTAPNGARRWTSPLASQYGYS